VTVAKELDRATIANDGPAHEHPVEHEQDPFTGRDLPLLLGAASSAEVHYANHRPAARLLVALKRKASAKTWIEVKQARCSSARSVGNGTIGGARRSISFRRGGPSSISRIAPHGRLLGALH
jgi:hypothetical protein